MLPVIPDSPPSLAHFPPVFVLDLRPELQTTLFLAKIASRSQWQSPLANLHSPSTTFIGVYVRTAERTAPLNSADNFTKDKGGR